MKLKRYFITLILVYMDLGTIFIVHGCMGLDKAQGLATEVNQAQTAIDTIRSEMSGFRDDLALISADDPDAQETADALLMLMGEKSAEAERWMNALSAANAKLAKAEDGWDILETVVGAASGFFPPLAVAVPMIRRSRNMFNGVIDAVAAGGGVVNADDTRTAMNMIPGLKQAVTNRRVEIGDKIMEAVKAKT